MSNETCTECFALTDYGHRHWCRSQAYDLTVADPKHSTAMDAELSRVTFASVFERMREHLKQDMYRRAMLPAHLLGGGRMRLPTGPITLLPDMQPAPSDRHVEALKYAIRPGWHLREHAGKMPPTLREWLGDRVSELGRWADVLREQPVPAGWIKRWEWRHDHLGWRLLGHTTIGYATPYEDSAVAWCLDGGPLVNALHGVQRDSLQMAFFTRHPDVKPEPRKVPQRTWFGNEE
jgi:hypothetical protein